MIDKLRAFTATLDRQEFYDFYALMTACASPACGDYVIVGGQFANLKKIVRRLRITAMYPRFNVDYAEAYTPQQAREDSNSLLRIFPSLTDVSQRNAVVKLIGALTIISQNKVPEK